jgi:hypothetical protein
MAGKDQMSKVNDYYLEVYRAHYKYHHEKETLVWLAASWYIASAGTATSWLLTHKGAWALSPSLPLFALLFYGACSTWFVIMQNLNKAHAAIAVASLENEIGRFDGSNLSYRDLYLIIQKANHPCCEQAFCSGWPGWILVMLMIAVLLCTVSLVFFSAIYPRTLCWLVDWLLAHLLRPVISL